MGEQVVVPEAIPQRVHQYLRERPILTLATSSPAGVPHATTLVFASDHHAVYVWLRPDTVTANHIDGNPSVAFTVDDYAPDWNKIKGVQASATAQVLLDADTIDQVVGLFAVKFPDLEVASTSNLSFFRLTPSALHFIDNESYGTTAGTQAIGHDFHRDLIYSVFTDLPPAHIETLAGRLETMSVDAGKVIVRQGAPADKFFIVVSGTVEVVRDSDDGEEQLARLGPGQFFGEVAILRDVPRTATVRALEATTLLTMDRETFRSLVAQSLATTTDLDEVIRQRLEQH